MRILLDPSAVEGGSENPEAKPVVPPAKAEVKAESKPGKVEVDQSEWEAARARLAKIDQDEADRKKAEKDKADQEAKARGEYDRLLREKDADIHDREAKLTKARGDYEALERDTARSFVEGALAVALSLPNLVDKAPGQLMKLFRDEFKAAREEGRWVVKSLDGRSPEDFIKAELEKPEYAHFRKAGHQGGGGGGNTPNPSNAATAPKTLGERMLEREAAKGKPVHPMLRKYANN